MKSFKGEALRWEWLDGVLELTLDRSPANEIGTVMLAELEKFVAAAKTLAPETSACIISSARWRAIDRPARLPARARS